MIQTYTGEGKGKTTAALGLVIRALGNGLRVGIVYFDKGGEFYNERKLLNKLIEIGLPLLYEATGLLRFDPAAKTFRFGVNDGDKKEAERGLVLAKQLSSCVDLLILDELNSTVSLGMLVVESVVVFLKDKPEGLEVVLTGRQAPKEIIELADLVTEMKMVKHYYKQGVEAREGIEY
ncbi:MAG: cob(I)yrinic acid a,c-diamide adenosyltransferase [bacterium]